MQFTDKDVQSNRRVSFLFQLKFASKSKHQIRSALANPTWDVFLLFASPVGFANNTAKAPTLRALESYSNVHLRNVNLWTYARDTPISSFIDNGQLFRSKYVNSHTSDFLRYLRYVEHFGT